MVPNRTKHHKYFEIVYLKVFTNYNDQTCSGSDRHKQTPIYVLNIFGKFCRLEGSDCGSSTVPEVGNAIDFSPKVFQQH